jgi:hypothetical protein
VSPLYFGLFNPSHYSPSPLHLPSPHFSPAFNTHPYILHLHILWYAISLMLYHSLPFPLPQFHGAVQLLHTCSTSEFVYDHAWFCAYVCLLDLSSVDERKCSAFVFLILANFTYIMSSNCIHLPSNPMSFSLWLSNTPLCIYHNFLIHSSVVEHLHYSQKPS